MCVSPPPPSNLYLLFVFTKCRIHSVGESYSATVCRRSLLDSCKEGECCLEIQVRARVCVCVLWEGGVSWRRLRDQTLPSAAMSNSFSSDLTIRDPNSNVFTVCGCSLTAATQISKAYSHVIYNDHGLCSFGNSNEFSVLTVWYKLSKSNVKLCLKITFTLSCFCGLPLSEMREHTNAQDQWHCTFWFCSQFIANKRT